MEAGEKAKLLNATLRTKMSRKFYNRKAKRKKALTKYLLLYMHLDVSEVKNSNGTGFAKKNIRNMLSFFPLYCFGFLVKN